MNTADFQPVLKCTSGCLFCLFVFLARGKCLNHPSLRPVNHSSIFDLPPPKVLQRKIADKHYFLAGPFVWLFFPASFLLNVILSDVAKVET